MGKPWEETKNRRRRRILVLRKKFLIYTEGGTEKAYLDHFKTTTNPEVVAVDASRNKLSLVKFAIEDRQRRAANDKFDPDYDVTWVVFDRDVDPKNSSDKSNFNNALTLAERNGIQVAYSNDSFELWYLLHFQEVSGPLHRREIDHKLSIHLGRTYKSRHRSKIEDLFDIVHSVQATALKRAENLYKKHTGESPESANPSTTVHLLIIDLMSEPGAIEK